MKKPSFPKFETGLVALGLLLLLWSACYGSLLLFGQQTTGAIEYSVRARGTSRGVSYRVHYSFTTDNGQPRRGTVSVGSSAAPLGAIKVRYLDFWPAIHAAGGTGALRFHACVTGIPGILLTALGARLLYIQRRTAARRKRQ